MEGIKDSANMNNSNFTYERSGAATPITMLPALNHKATASSCFTCCCHIGAPESWMKFLHILMGFDSLGDALDYVAKNPEILEEIRSKDVINKFTPIPLLEEKEKEEEKDEKKSYADIALKSIPEIHSDDEISDDEFSIHLTDVEEEDEIKTEEIPIVKAKIGKIFKSPKTGKFWCKTTDLILPEDLPETYKNRKELYISRCKEEWENKTISFPLEMIQTNMYDSNQLVPAAGFDINVSITQ